MGVSGRFEGAGYPLSIYHIAYCNSSVHLKYPNFERQAAGESVHIN